MDDTSCVTNSECSPGQYCYGLSQTCVDYTRCSRYNRQEGPKHAETPAIAVHVLLGMFLYI